MKTENQILTRITELTTVITNQAAEIESLVKRGEFEDVCNLVNSNMALNESVALLNWVLKNE